MSSTATSCSPRARSPIRSRTSKSRTATSSAPDTRAPWAVSTDEELFYLQSRGIPETEARKLVVRGFFGELVEEIGVPFIAEHLMNVIDRRLARGESDAMKAVLEDK